MNSPIKQLQKQEQVHLGHGKDRSRMFYICSFAQEVLHFSDPEHHFALSAEEPIKEDKPPYEFEFIVEKFGTWRTSNSNHPSKKR